MGRTVFIAAQCALFLALSACDSTKPGVMVFVAASAADAVDSVAVQFESETGIAVSVNAASSSVLAQQIAAGAEADLFLSANVAWVDYLTERGEVDSRVDLLGNGLVLVVPVDDTAIHSPEDLLGDPVRRIAIADPDSVPAGQYAKKAFVALGLWDALEQKVIPGGDVRQTLAYVERGEAEAGIVYATDALISGKVRPVYGFTDEVTGPIVYPLILTKRGGESEAARQFFEFLQTPDIQAEFGQRGFRARIQ